MKSFIFTCFMSYFLLFSSVQARTIADVKVAESLQQENTTLTLNGAGIRKKLFFKIYVASLYLPKKQTNVAKILAKDEPRQIILNFVYSRGVSKAKIVKAWNEGFEENLSSKVYQQLASKIATFNNMFGDLNEGDKVILSYIPNKGTKVIINNKIKGNIATYQFNNALLKIWIGEEPASDDLKESLLGID